MTTALLIVVIVLVLLLGVLLLRTRTRPAPGGAATGTAATGATDATARAGDRGESGAVAGPDEHGRAAGFNTGPGAVRGATGAGGTAGGAGLGPGGVGGATGAGGTAGGAGLGAGGVGGATGAGGTADGVGLGPDGATRAEGTAGGLGLRPDAGGGATRAGGTSGGVGPGPAGPAARAGSTGPGSLAADGAARPGGPGGVGAGDRDTGVGSTTLPADGEISPELMARARRIVEEDLAQLRFEALQSAAAARAEADTMAATTRRLAEAEADAVRRGARSEAEAIRAAVAAEAEKARRQAELEVSTTLLDARRQAERDAAEITETARAVKQDLDRRESRLAEREERVEANVRRVEQRSTELVETEQALAEREAQLAGREGEHERELERIAGLTAADARAELLRAVEERTRRDAAILVRDLEAEAQSEGEQRARKIVVDAIQRVASEQTAESVVSVLQLPADEMKGRIIGREGRNIRAFESVTGVNLIIDDTPEAVLLSCFDPVRREIGRITLEKLVLDGRIHPHRIEEVYERSKEEVEALCVRAGEDALVEVGISDLHPELLTLLGRLRYRTSYGQNVLKHLIETAHIAGIMAAELGLEPTVIKRGAFLHDIGKALTHEVEGSHALIGADLVRKYGESEEVAHAIEAHHNEVAPRTIAAVLTQAADSCSGGRPGARRESLESYVKRLQRIEEIAAGKPGVERVFAMQAGREVRVMVQPDAVDDLTAQMLAREVAQQIEDELTYPGQIRITVVRESRSTEIAH
jgi:ribonuclease Y